jgi:hypothetical protein
MAYSALTRVRPGLAPLALLALLGGCGDAATGGVGHGRAALAVAPEFPEGHVTGSLNLVVDQVKVRVVRPPSEWVVDTSAAFPANASTMTMRVQVPLKARTERMEVVLELWAGPLLVFAGSRPVEVVEGAGSATATFIPLTYRGPGAEARVIRITPRDTVLRPGQSFTFAIEADNGSGVPVGDVYVNWSLGTTSGGSLTPAGVLTTPAARSSVLVRARAATGARDSTVIWVAPAPAIIEPLSGGGQTSVVGRTLPAPLVTRVLAGDGLGVPGLLVHFTGPAGSTLSPAVARTDAGGFARTTVTLAGRAGPQAFMGFLAGIGAVQFVVQGQVDAPSEIVIVRGNNQQARPGQMVPIPLEVAVRDQFGNPVRDALVRWEVIGGGGALGLTSTLTDAAGVALSAYQMGPGTGNNLVRATLDATATSVVFLLVPPGGE